MVPLQSLPLIGIERVLQLPAALFAQRLEVALKLLERLRGPPRAAAQALTQLRQILIENWAQPLDLLLRELEDLRQLLDDRFPRRLDGLRVRPGEKALELLHLFTVERVVQPRLGLGCRWMREALRTSPPARRNPARLACRWRS